MAVACMCNASGHNYRSSSFIVDLAVGQIPRYHVPQNVFLVSRENEHVSMKHSTMSHRKAL